MARGPRFTTVLSALIAGAACASTLAAQHVNGTLLDKASSAPIVGAQVSLVPVDARAGTLTVTTDSAGEFSLTGAAPGTYRILVRRIGLLPAETHAFWLGPLTEHAPVLRMETVGIRSDTVRVTTRGLPSSDWTQEFYDRRRTTHGVFLTRADLIGRAPVLATDWLIGARGVTVMPIGGHSYAVARTMGRSCRLEVWVDRLPLNDGDVNALLRADDIAAMEVYPSISDAPLRYQARGCGVLLVWTRAGRGDVDVAEGEPSRGR
ncbi:MAG: carboxypeptidase regulatory-like domain-containing protein [Gemmatimonadetes bacterium]|nr:carboxypeptidase regulatory-like domain-containing protein [Gemmatimonadota bacterium]